MIRIILASIALVLCPFTLLTVRAQSDRKSLVDIKTVQTEALSHPSSYRFLETLSDEIGPRLTGSSSEARARSWAREEMIRIGLKNVHGEAWQLQRGWNRGYARAELVAPFPLELRVAAYGWSGSTPSGGVAADVVLVDSGALDQEARRRPTAWAGKILLLLPHAPEHFDVLKSLSQLPQFLEAARQAHAVAVIASDMRPGSLLPHTGPVSFSGGWTGLPVVDMASEQRTMIARILDGGKPVRLRLDIQNQLTDGPVSSQNVVGEIPGSEHPEQVLVVAAHLDSWDLGTGATDDGFGVAAVLGAAQAIAASGVKPKRTLRFVLFTGEEQGMLGSRAYIEHHRAELSNIVAALALDWGNGPVTKVPLAGHQEFAGPLQELFQANDLFHGFAAPDGYLTFTDAYAFTMAGVAGLALFQDSPNSTMIGHSGADTLDKVNEEILTRDTAIVAVLALWISDYPARIGAQWPLEKMSEFRQKQHVLLQMLGQAP